MKSNLFKIVAGLSVLMFQAAYAQCPKGSDSLRMAREGRLPDETKQVFFRVSWAKSTNDGGAVSSFTAHVYDVVRDTCLDFGLHRAMRMVSPWTGQERTIHNFLFIPEPLVGRFEVTLKDRIGQSDWKRSVVNVGPVKSSLSLRISFKKPWDVFSQKKQMVLNPADTELFDPFDLRISLQPPFRGVTRDLLEHVQRIRPAQTKLMDEITKIAREGRSEFSIELNCPDCVGDSTYHSFAE